MTKTDDDNGLILLVVGCQTALAISGLLERLSKANTIADSQRAS
jgi:hypothetical protein